MKQLVIDKEHPNGIIVEVVPLTRGGISTSITA